MVQRTCLRSRNRDTDIENKHLRVKWGRGEWNDLENWD